MVQVLYREYKSGLDPKRSVINQPIDKRGEILSPRQVRVSVTSPRPTTKGASSIRFQLPLIRPSVPFYGVFFYSNPLARSSFPFSACRLSRISHPLDR